MGFSIKLEQLPVVIAHFFKVRSKPLPVYRVAGKASTEVVVYAAAAHFLQGKDGMLQRFLVARNEIVPQQKLQVERVGKLGRTAKPAKPLIEPRLQLRHYLVGGFNIVGS